MSRRTNATGKAEGPGDNSERGALGEGEQHPDAELEDCGVTRAERDDLTGTRPRRSHDGVRERQTAPLPG